MTVAKDPAMRALRKIAAECHRAKWGFDMGDDRPTLARARALVAKAFDELHRIGDMALKLRAEIEKGPAE